MGPLAWWVLVWSSSPLSLLSLPLEKRPANGIELGNPKAQWEGWECLEKKSMFWDAGPALGLPECGRCPWNHSTIPWAAQPQLLTPISKGSRAFSHFSSKLSTPKASFPQISSLTAQTHLDQPPRNIPKVLMDIFGLESGGMAPTLSPPWDTRGAKSLDQAQHFPGLDMEKRGKKNLLLHPEMLFLPQFCRKVQQVWKNPSWRAKVEMPNQAQALILLGSELRHGFLLKRWKIQLLIECSGCFLGWFCHPCLNL